MNKNEHPVTAYSIGGVYGINPSECAQETPIHNPPCLNTAMGKSLSLKRAVATEFRIKSRTSIGNISTEQKVTLSKQRDMESLP